MQEHRCYGCMTVISEEVCPHCGYSGQDNPPHQLPVGTVLRGQYFLGRVLGQGGFGITYLGYDMNLQETVAVKEFYPTSMVSRDTRVSHQVTISFSKLRQHYEQSRERFLREAQTLARLRHIPQIVHIRDFFEENDTAYIVMEYVRGQELGEYVKQQGGTLSVKGTLGFLQPVMLALEEVHQAGLVHRDISPDNIMLLPDGGVKIIDFGASREVTDAQADKDLTASTEAILKHGYAPIEQYRNHGSLGPWTDEYAICGVIWHCLTGKVPPDAPAIAMGEEEVDWDALPGLSQSQRAALRKGMAVKARDRFPSVRELAQALDSRQAGLKKKRKALTMVGICAAVLLVTGTLLWMFASPKQDIIVESVPTSVPTEPATEAQTEPPTTQPPTTQPVKLWQENILRADPLRLLAEAGACADPAEIESVAFLDTLEGAPETAVDLSEGADGRVLGWLDGTDAYIAAEGGINGKLACAHLFENCVALTTVTFGENFHTEEAIDMSCMFYNCMALTSVDTANLNTSGVVTMEYMFYWCDSIKEVDVADWDTGNVQNMRCMFSCCGTLLSLDVSRWDTWKVEDMSDMFSYCESLTELDVSRWDTGKVKDVSHMFYYCESLTELDVSRWDTGKVKDMSDMFYMSSVVRLDVRWWDVSSVEDMSGAFAYCSELTYLDVMNWDTSSVTDISQMFQYCWMINLDVFMWDFSAVTKYDGFMNDNDYIQGIPWEEYIRSGEWKNYG